MDDWELLQDFVRTRSDPAFAELVRRHIDWIYSVALRRVCSSVPVDLGTFTAKSNLSARK